MITGDNTSLIHCFRPTRSSMLPSSAIFRRLRALAPAAFLFLALALASRLSAVVADDIAPANLIGKTFAFTVVGANAGAVNLEPTVNAYTVQFTSATNYLRAGKGVTTEGGTYTVLSSVDTPVARVTAIQMNNNWLAPGSTTTVLLSLSVPKIITDIGTFTANEILTPTRSNGGTFDLNGSGGGGGGTTQLPAITAPNTLSATIGTAFSYQVVATNSPTRYAAAGLPAGLAINATTGLISGTPTGPASTTGINVSATNTAGTTTISIVFAVVSGAGGGGNAQDGAPVNLVGYRNKVGQTFQFVVTGAGSGTAWGTDIYTDDSPVARAAVHAGVVAVGQSKTVTITILGGQASYAASTRNGVTTAAWGSWPGSYAFAGSTGATATAKPAVATGYVATVASLAVGGRFVLPVTVTGGGTYTYQWYLNNVLIVGATANPYVVESLTAGNAGSYSVDVANALGTTRIAAGTITVGAAGSPVIALQPFSKVAAPGSTVTFATSASGTGLTYQWLRNGVAIAGETGAIILRQNVNANDAGTYTVRISNSAGSVTSAGGVLTISPDASRLANISVRTNVATGTSVIPGFVIQGTGTKRLLIRAVGPGLGAFGLTGVMADPKLTLFQGSTKVSENDDWSAANIGTAFAGTGAFGLAAGSKDAALVTDLTAGLPYSVVVTNASGTGGIVLIEVYDADALKGTSTSKLVNVSVRGPTATGADVLTLGLVLGGTGQRSLLVRGAGPALAAFGVTGALPDPRLQIVDSQQRAILANDDWGSADFVNELAIATNYVGAFAFGAGSKDAATLSLVDPGAYTVQVSGAAAAPTGEALVEVYEVP
jgi:LCCL domain-containing protein/putative Ig domain-containing protein